MSTPLNFKTNTTMKINIYFFTSTRKSDKCSQITICTWSEKRAFGLALAQFYKHGYKGSPRRILAV